MEPRATLKIPRPLYDRLSEIIEGSGFASVTEFVVYVLRDLVSHQEGKVEGALSAREVEAIRERLKNMGYL